MGLLDSLLRTMNMFSLDMDDPRASVFTSLVPVVPSDSPRRLSQLSAEDFPASQIEHTPVNHRPPAWRSVDSLPLPVSSDLPPDDHNISSHSHLPQQSYSPAHGHEQPSANNSACTCMTFTLGHTWPRVREFAPLWDMTPTWQSEWTESDIRKEECRRLVWSSVMLSAGHSSYTAASSGMETQQLFLMDPRNVSLPHVH